MAFTMRTTSDLVIEVGELKITIAPAGFKDLMFASEMVEQQGISGKDAFQFYLVLSRVKAIDGVIREDNGKPFTNWDYASKQSFFGDNPQILSSLLLELAKKDAAASKIAGEENPKNLQPSQPGSADSTEMPAMIAD